jgi:NAD-dependent SIR2 family protein deacetylase
MKRIYYVECPNCHKDYYISKELYRELKNNPKLELQCPYCKGKFFGQKAFIRDAD